MTAPLIYVAGPITDDPWGCVRKAIKVGMELRDLGAVPYLPQLSVLHEMIEPLSHAEWMRDDLEILARCDGIIRLPGESVGADMEVDEARQLGLPIYFVGSGAALLDDFVALAKTIAA